MTVSWRANILAADRPGGPTNLLVGCRRHKMLYHACSLLSSRTMHHSTSDSDGTVYQDRTHMVQHLVASRPGQTSWPGHPAARTESRQFARRLLCHTADRATAQAARWSSRCDQGDGDSIRQSARIVNTQGGPANLVGRVAQRQDAASCVSDSGETVQVGGWGKWWVGRQLNNEHA